MKEDDWTSVLKTANSIDKLKERHCGVERKKLTEV